MSASMSKFLINSSDFSEKGYSAWGKLNQANSYEFTANVSGMDKPWSMGISLRDS